MMWFLLWHLTRSGSPQPHRGRRSAPGERMKPLLLIGLALCFAGTTSGVLYVVGGFVVLVVRWVLVTLEEMNQLTELG
jgi:hypothetical protein